MSLPWDEPGEDAASGFTISWESLPESPAELIRLRYPRLPAGWFESLPSPEIYYRGRVSAFGTSGCRGWALGQCPFHDDQEKSFAVDLRDAHGHWVCYACQEMGDMIDFHRRTTGQEFLAAVLDLLGLQE